LFEIFIIYILKVRIIHSKNRDLAKNISHNIILLKNQAYQRPRRQIMDVFVFTKLGTP